MFGKKKLTAKQICQAFNENSRVLVAMELSIYGQDKKSLSVHNQQVLLSAMLRNLGFTDEEIDGHLYSRFPEQERRMKFREKVTFALSLPFAIPTILFTISFERIQDVIRRLRGR